MDDASVGSAARFRPTWQQALGRGLYLGVLVAVAGVSGGLFAVLVLCSLLDLDRPPHWLWALLGLGPVVLGAVLGVLVLRRIGTVIDGNGIRTVSPFAAGTASWRNVVDLRAERRGARTVVSVYLDSGDSVQLRAPYSGDLFAADPQFELKVFALSHLWRSHRFGGVPS
jgi:hypothetical protein